MCSVQVAQEGSGSTEGGLVHMRPEVLSTEYAIMGPGRYVLLVGSKEGELSMRIGCAATTNQPEDVGCGRRQWSAVTPPTEERANWWC